jgi:hypothetical protein
MSRLAVGNTRVDNGRGVAFYDPAHINSGRRTSKIQSR